MAFCTQCGTNAQEGARFCAKCGHTLHAADPTEHQGDAAQPADGAGATGNVNRPGRGAQLRQYSTALVAAVLVAGAILALHPWSGSVAVCSGDSSGCSGSDTVSASDPNAKLEVNTGWFSHGSQAVARVYDSNNEQVTFCNLDLGGGGDELFSFKDCFVKPSILTSGLQTGQTYSLSVAYGSLFGGSQGAIGQTTFTYQS